MIKIYITSNQPKAGKTTLAGAFAKFFQENDKKTAYLKLSNTSHPKGYIPEDSEDLSPSFSKILDHIQADKEEDGIVCDEGLEKLENELDSLRDKYEIILIESDNFLDSKQNLAFDKKIADAVQASVVKLIWYNESSMGDGDITTIQNESAYFKGNLSGIIINGVPSTRTHYVETEILSKLSATNLPTTHVISQDPNLNSRSFGEIIDFLDGEVVAFEEHLDRPVTTVMLGALALDGGIYYYGKYPEKIVITRWDRPDLQMPALNTGCQGLILTGGNGPIPYILNRVNELKTPVAVVSNGTVAVATNLSQGFFAEKGNTNKSKTTHFLDLLVEGNYHLLNEFNIS